MYKVETRETVSLGAYKAWKESKTAAGEAVVGNPIGLPGALVALGKGHVFDANIFSNEINVIKLNNGEKVLYLPLFQFTCEYGNFQTTLPDEAYEILERNVKVALKFVLTEDKNGRLRADFVSARNAASAAPEQDQTI